MLGGLADLRAGSEYRFPVMTRSSIDISFFPYVDAVVTASAILDHHNQYQVQNYACQPNDNLAAQDYAEAHASRRKAGPAHHDSYAGAQNSRGKTAVLHIVGNADEAACIIAVVPNVLSCVEHLQ